MIRITKDQCLAYAKLEGDIEISAGSMSHPLRQPECAHEWKDIESMGNNEWFTDVRCVRCRMSGQRDHSDDSVYWPAT